MPIDVNSNGSSDRRSASPRRESDITTSKYPIITRTAYNAMQNADMGGSKTNLKMKCLAMGRIKLYQAKLDIDAAMRHFNPQVPDPKNPRTEDKETYNKLRAISEKMEKCFRGYPISIVNT